MHRGMLVHGCQNIGTSDIEDEGKEARKQLFMVELSQQALVTVSANHW